MTIVEVDAQRARWERYRSKLGLTEDAGDDFALGGLGRLVTGLNARLVVLPADPLDAIALDAELLERLKHPRPAPFGSGHYEWGEPRTTPEAAQPPLGAVVDIVAVPGLELGDVAVSWPDARRRAYRSTARVQAFDGESVPERAARASLTRVAEVPRGAPSGGGARHPSNASSSRSSA